MNQGLGRFTVMGRLGRGGMAEAYVCKLKGIGGFEKEVVVKRIIPERANDPNFVRMFLDEARISANLSHPHIVQVFEIGEDGGIPYMVMEYVRGLTLGMIGRQLHRERRASGHFGHSAKIIAGICEALDYAHRAVNAAGQPLGLVHRDVSPGNIIVSREGVPKLLDFGVAKALGSLAHTEAGTIKGKISYMAPEQVPNGPLDHRADIFSLGVCLYEITVGRNPFRVAGQNEVAALKNIVDGVFPRPSAIRPDYPPELEEIVLRAIAHDVDRRCGSARELSNWLETFTAQGEHRSSQRAIEGWMRELFPDFDQLTGKAAGLAAFGGGGSSGAKPEPVTSATRPLTPSPRWPTLDLVPQVEVREEPTIPTDELPTRPGVVNKADLSAATPPGAPGAMRLRARWPLLAAAALVAAAVVAVAVFGFRRPPRPVVSAPAHASEGGRAAITRPGRAPGGDDDVARGYLVAAETLAKERRFDLAREMLGKAASLKIENKELGAQLAALSDAVATAESPAAKRSSHGEKTRPARVVAVAVAARTGKEASKDTGKEAGRDKAGRESAGREVAVRDAEPRYPEPRYPEQRSPRQAAVPEAAVAAVEPRGGGAVAAKISDAPGAPATRAEPAAPPPEKPKPEPAAAAPERPRAEPALTARPTPAIDQAQAASPPPVAAVEAARGGSGPVVSVMPRSPIPKPRLARTIAAESPSEVVAACQQVEAAAISTGGVSPEFARGITGPFRRSVGGHGELHPVAMYYFIIREASLKHDNRSAAAALVAAQSSGLLLRLQNLPAIEPAP
jgi:serine/threonine protein kinase